MTYLIEAQVGLMMPLTGLVSPVARTQYHFSNCSSEDKEVAFPLFPETTSYQRNTSWECPCVLLLSVVSHCLPSLNCMGQALAAAASLGRLHQSPVLPPWDYAACSRSPATPTPGDWVLGWTIALLLQVRPPLSQHQAIGSFPPSSPRPEQSSSR